MTTPRVHISLSNRKLGEIPSVNLPPILTCNRNAPCTKGGCYACKNCFRFKNVKQSMSDNLAVWKTDKAQFKAAVKRAAYFNRYFRYHSAGDIPDADYLQMMVDIAKELPKTNFLAYTKKYDLIDNYIDLHGDFPKNLTIVLSAWGSFKPENKHHLPVSYVKFRHKNSGAIPADSYQCSGDCTSCVMSKHNCWNLKHNESVTFNEH